jgi:hypothetical protein
MPVVVLKDDAGNFSSKNLYSDIGTALVTLQYPEVIHERRKVLGGYQY